MRRKLLRTTAFVRAAKRIVKRNQVAANNLREALLRLEQDAFDPVLRTHKLKGDLEDRWACTCEYDLRVVFRFVTHDGADAISLLNVGTHDEVY